MLKIMLGDLLLKRKIKTTLAKAKELKKMGDRLIGLSSGPVSENAKRSMNVIRQNRTDLPRNISPKILEEIAAGSDGRRSGFIRVTKMNSRRSDGAAMGALEIIKTGKPREEKS